MTEENKQLDLVYIASRLEGMEETIISKLIDRAQFAVNATVYETGKSGFTGEPTRSLFDLRMYYHEHMDALFGRFCVPEERPFTHDLPEPKRTVILPDTGLCIDKLENVNYTKPIRSAYMNLVGKICRAGDDSQYGSSVEHDVYAVQAIARRVHFGAYYVAESKFRSDPESFRRLIEEGDAEAIESILTRQEVEAQIIDRVRRKTIETQRGVNPLLRNIIDAEEIVQFYHTTIIPLTKKGEVSYLLHRCPATSASPSAQYKFNS